MKLQKILIVMIAVVVIAASVGFGYFIAKHPADSKQTPTVKTDTTQTTEKTEEYTDEEKTSESASKSSGETETAEKASGSTSQTANPNSGEKSIKELILGSWRDNADFSGYEFFSGGTMKVTYFNMSNLNLEDVIEGTYSGTYTLDGDRLTVSYTVYSKAINKVYTVRVDENTLSMRDEKGEEAIYIRKNADSKMKNVDERLLGKWESNLSGYEFKDTGVVSITYINLSSMGINLPFNGTVDGIYTLDGDELTIKFSIYTGVIQKTYRYSVDGNVLTLKEKGGRDTGTYTRKGD